MSDVDEMIRQANARRKKRWPFFVVVLGVFALPFLFIGYSYWAKHRREHRFDLDADGKKDLAQKLDDAEKEIARREATYREVVTREKLAAFEATSERCPTDAPDASEVTRPNEPVPRGDTSHRFATRIGLLRKKLAEGRTTRDDLAQAGEVAAKDGWRGAADTLVMAEEIVDAQMSRDPDTMRIGFIAGHIVGRAYLYSYDEARIVCAGRFEGRSSQTLEVKYQSTSISPTLEDPGTFLARTEAEKTRLREDLFSQTRIAAKDSLRAVR